MFSPCHAQPRETKGEAANAVARAEAKVVVWAAQAELLVLTAEVEGVLFVEAGVLVAAPLDVIKKLGVLRGLCSISVPFATHSR